MKSKAAGIFCISLDFELYWGIRDKKTIEEYGENVRGVWTVVPRLLSRFREYDLHATWAVVGAMMAENYEELLQYTPKIKPEYQESVLSPYREFYSQIPNIEKQYLFGWELLKQVKSCPYQELGTHTFSHYYCLEDGQNSESFFSDLQSCIEISKKNNFIPKSLAFPRHQLNEEYIAGFQQYGIKNYRGTEKIWYNAPAKSGEESILKRICRFADYYIPMFSQHCQDLEEVKKGGLYRIRASRWLRPYSKKWEKLDFLKIARIKSQMTYAAQKGKIFHLWFHPHDIGRDQEQNFKMLEEIFSHFKTLQSKYAMQSKNMEEIAQLYQEKYE